MRIADHSFAAWAATFYAALGLTPLTGCGGTVVERGGDGGNENGGTTASGGATASGGMTASGGTTPSGGVTASGGTTSSGGLTASGGMTASGGTTPTGGTTTAGGTTASGGTSTGGFAGKNTFIDCVPGSGAGSGYEACNKGALHRSSKEV